MRSILQRIAVTLIIGLLILPSAFAQLKHPIRDEQGRHVIPRGFVINTEDKEGNIYYSSNDYHRMVRMGANFQVIRLRLGALGGYPGNQLKESYLLHLDSLVQMGKNAGLKTDFKLTGIFLLVALYSITDVREITFNEPILAIVLNRSS